MMFTRGVKMSHKKSCGELFNLQNDILMFDGLLDKEEKIGLVFLMCDDAAKAHCILVKNIIENSAHKEILPDLFSILSNCDSGYLKEKLIESLIIIKNIKMVHLLGYSHSEIECLKSSLNKNECHINLVRKELLRMCEDLSIEELTVLVQLVENDFASKEIYYFHRCSRLMEINILYWIQEGYISDDIEGRKCDVHLLIQHLLVMKKYDLAKKLGDLHDLNLKKEKKNLRMMFHDNDLMEKVCDPECDYKLMIPKNFTNEDTDVYAMDRNNMGLCVIINQRNFVKTSHKYDEVRHGTDNDRDQLKITFLGFGYEIIILENLDKVSFLKCIKNILKEKVKISHSSFILCILSHGKRDHVYCVDGSELPVEEIENMLMGDKCPELCGKPKIVIVQACQGNTLQKAVPCLREVNDDEDFKMLQCDGPSDAVIKKIPPTADILTYWATVPGYASLRHRYSGSEFIQTLCAQLLKDGNSEHFVDIITSVNREMSKKFGPDSVVVMPQVRGFTHTKKLYFPYSSENRCKASESLLLKYLVDHLIRESIVKLALLKNYKKAQK